MLLPDVGALGPTDTVTVSGVVPLVGLIWSQPLGGKVPNEIAVAPAEELITIVVEGIAPGVVLKVTEDGFDENVCALAVSKQHTTANMSVPSPNKAFFVIFKTPPHEQDVPVKAKDGAAPK